MPWAFDPTQSLQGGRCTAYAHPTPSTRQRCSLGIDFARGIEGGDSDCGIILDADGNQMLTVCGHWGENFGAILKPIIEYYEPFIVGERTVYGLAILRQLYDAGYWVYFERSEASRGRPTRDILGHNPTADDVTLVRLRQAIGPRDDTGKLLPPRIGIRDEETLNQCCKFGFQPRSSTVEPEGARDSQLKPGAPVGEHDDHVRALGLSLCGLEWLPLYTPPKPKFAENTFGALMGLNDDDEPVQKNRWR